MTTFTTDAAALERDQRDLLLESIRAAVREVNQAAYNIAHEAMVHTPHGDPRAIEARLRAPATRVRGLSPGEPYPSVAAALVNARRGRRGRKGLTGAPMRRASESLIRKKKLGAYYVAAGFLEALKKLAPFVQRTRQIPPYIVDFGLPDGDATLARLAGESVVATISNHSRGAERLAGPVAEKALAKEADELADRFEEQLERIWNRPPP